MADSLPYEPDDRGDDLAWTLARHNADDDSGNLTATMAYFERKYGAAADDRIARLYGALRYFKRHDSNFDGEEFSCAGRLGTRYPSPALWLALLVIFNGVGEDQIDHDWDADEVKKIARELLQSGEQDDGA